MKQVPRTAWRNVKWSLCKHPHRKGPVNFNPLPFSDPNRNMFETRVCILPLSEIFIGVYGTNSRLYVAFERNLYGCLCLRNLFCG